MHSSFLHEQSIGIKPKLYWNREENSRRFRDIALALGRMLEHLTRPEATPINARHWLKDENRNIGRPHGGFTMQDKAIRFSARALTELLAGKIDQKQFLENHDFKHATPFFERQL